MTLVHTIGHSTRSLEEFLGLLRTFAINHVVDVRRFPASRRHPHFARDALAAALAGAGMGYTHEPAMGGFRSPRQDSPHVGWRTPGFRGYADHMESPEFQTALERLIERARAERVAVMCAEATPWRCHRQLIADALVARGAEVIHILGSARGESHALRPGVRVLDGGRRLVYEGEEGDRAL
jgi:uncharacterized protein (DUF488 family)